MNLSRRDFIVRSGMLVFAAGVMSRPTMLLAQAPTDQRLFVVILRGAMDGLAAVVPYADPDYASARGPLAMPDSALVALDRFFAMNQALGPFADLYKQNQLLALHASATPYRSRSHFDAQNVLDSGATEAHALNTGWLNRSISALQGLSGVAIGPSVPLMLQGPGNVTSWSPSKLPEADEDLLARIARMYQHDALLSKALGEAGSLEGDSANPDMAGMAQPKGNKAFNTMMDKAGSLLAGATLRVGAIELGGWDTHSGQGLDKGRLANAMAQLTDGITTFKQALGPVWKQTAVLVVTEFGRTVRGNGTGGSDHGTGSVAFLMGGSVAGGRIIGDWPGLTQGQLYQGRDLYPANDMRALIKGVLNTHMGVSNEVLAQRIFPGSDAVAPTPGLFRV